MYRMCQVIESTVNVLLFLKAIVQECPFANIYFSSPKCGLLLSVLSAHHWFQIRDLTFENDSDVLFEMSQRNLINTLRKRE